MGFVCVFSSNQHVAFTQFFFHQGTGLSADGRTRLRKTFW